ncbi:MAG: hypothetical protein IKD12_01695 [Paludibacteraceae bacterium]|nr:hypothetical protein [Paludibacteraceae bacterium]
MKDFSLDIYRELLETLQRQGYELIGYADYLKAKRQEQIAKRFVILRHDVDARPQNSLKTAQIEHALGAKATYYFRKPTSGSSLKGRERGMTEPEIIRAIAKLGHEIGYHYEDMSLCGGDVNQAWSHFQTWLEYFRQYYAVETICMHGAPTSKWDGKDLWKQYDYKELGVIGEPYLDTDFSDVFYLTDTGRCWDGYKVSVRDKIPQYQDEWTQAGLTWHTTQQLLLAIEQGKLPKHVMMTTHPQRWTNNKGAWLKEIVLQNMKNIVKKLWIRN